MSSRHALAALPRTSLRLSPASSGWHHRTSDAFLYSLLWSCLSIFSFVCLFPRTCPYSAMYRYLRVFILAIWTKCFNSLCWIRLFMSFCQFNRFWISVFLILSLLDTPSVFHRQAISKTFDLFLDIALIMRNWAWACIKHEEDRRTNKFAVGLACITVLCHSWVSK